MAIQIIDGFQVNTALPIDNRIVASGSTARNAIPYKYEGLRVFDTSDGVPYVWVNGAWQSENSTSISGSGTANRIPLYTSSNVIANSIIYQSGSSIGINTTSLGSTFSVNGSLSATTLGGDGSALSTGVIVNASNITTGSLALNRLTNGSTGWILTGGASSPAYVSPAQVTVGTASVASNVTVTQTTTNATHYLAFVSSGAWTSVGGSSTIRANSNANNISYNPFTNILSTGKINSNLGSLPTSATSKLSFVNLTSTTLSLSNTSNLEFNNVRTSTGTDWLSTGYRIQAKVDAEYMGYIQFNGDNETGISFGTGYMSTDGTSNSYEKMRLDINGRLMLGTNTSLYSPNVLHIKSNATLSDGLVHRAYNNANWIFSFQNSSGTTRGQIDGTDGTSIAYQTSSDRRLKKDILDMPSMYDTIKNLKPSKFKWKENDKEDFGFIAQDVYNILPNLRGDMSDIYFDLENIDLENPVRKDGTQHYYGLDYGKLTPYLTKALQETIQKLETLTNKIKSANTLEELKSSL